MFEKLAQTLQNLRDSQIPFDSAQFNDPVAEQTDWRPCRGGGNNFRTFKLVQVNPNRVEFKTTVGAVIFSLIFALPGIGMLVFLVPNLDWSSIHGGNMIPLLLGLVFTSLGSYMFYIQMMPIVFDKQEGLFWKKRRPQAGIGPDETSRNYARLESIHALQIIAEYIQSKNQSYYSYELNLVLKDGHRINVVDHGKRKKLLEDAEVLAGFLGVPVWNTTTSGLPTNVFSVTSNHQ